MIASPGVPGRRDFVVEFYFEGIPIVTRFAGVVATGSAESGELKPIH
jgi:hypothetical protein